MTDSVERLLVRIDATSEQLRRELNVADNAVEKADKSIGARLQKMQKRFTETAKRAAKLGAAAGVAGAAITAKLVSAGLESVDSLAKVSNRLGIATEELAALRFAAEQTGVSTNTLDMALQRMTRRVAEAAKGTGEAQGALKELGLDAQALNELAPDQVFRAITAAMEGVDNQSDKVRLAMKLFDSEGVSLVQTMNAGVDALDEFAEQARIAGLTINEFDAAKVEAANDAMNRVRKQVTGLSQQLAVRFAPILEGIADRLFGVGAEAGGMGNIATRVFDAVVAAAGFVGDSIRVIQIGWHGMKLAFQESYRFVVGGLDNLAQFAIEMWNKLPWNRNNQADVQTMFGGFLATMDAEIAASRSKIDSLLTKPLPSDAIEEWSETHTRTFNAAAIEVGKLDEATANLQLTTNEATEALAKDWDRALQGTFERIDQSFSQAWQGAFNSFNDFADGIKNALRNLLGELAHLAISKPILLNIAGALGIGGVSSGAMASSGIGGIFSGGLSGATSGLLGGFANMGAGLYNAIGNGASFLADFGVPGMDWLSTTSFGKGMTMTGAGALGNLGAGLLGGLLSNSVFGPTSGIGSTLGGIAGSFIPIPFVGTAIGSFLGGGLESLLGGKPSDKTGTALLNLGTGGIDIGGLSGSKFSQENRDAAGQLAQQFGQFAALLGGSTGSLDIGVGSRDGLRLDGRDYGQNIDAFMSAGFQKIIDGASQLDPALRNLIDSFQGSSDELMAFSGAMVSVSNAIGGNVVTEIRAAWEDMAGGTAIDAYYSQIDAISELVSNFDRSAESAVTLNAALAQNQEAAALLAVQVLQVAEQLDGMFGNSAKQIRESVMSEAELFKVRKAERNSLRASLGTITDPQQLAQAAAEINRLNLELFNSLGDPSAQQAENFALYAEQTNELAQDRLDTILAGIEEAQTLQNDRIQAMMESAASQQQTAADTFLAAAGRFDAAVAAFLAGGGEVNA